MRDITLIKEFEKHAEAINRIQDAVQAHSVAIIAADARIRCHEDMVADRGAFLLLALRNIFNPKGVKDELARRYTAYAHATPKAAKAPCACDALAEKNK